MSAPIPALQAPPVDLVEAIQTKLKGARNRPDIGMPPSAVMTLNDAEVDALRYLCGLYRLSAKLRPDLIHPGGHINKAECDDA